MKTKPGQRVAYYEVTGKTENADPAFTLGMILVDRPRGETTWWEFWNEDTNERSSVSAKRLGFARMDADNKKAIPEPGLKAVLDARKRTDVRP